MGGGLGKDESKYFIYDYLLRLCFGEIFCFMEFDGFCFIECLGRDFRTHIGHRSTVFDFRIELILILIYFAQFWWLFCCMNFI